MSLISNGLKYSEPNTGLFINAVEGDGEIITSVTDRGSGISPDDLLRIFERFYRAKDASRTEGLGLGLYITKWLVENQRGRIWAESEPGKGSTFHFTLPTA